MSCQKRLEEPACVALFARRDGLGVCLAPGWFPRAFRPRADVDEVVAHLQHVEVMLDHHHGVALVHELVEDVDEQLHVLKCRPVVGSSKMYKVLPVLMRASSDANLTRCASPPLSVVLCCPSVM